MTCSDDGMVRVALFGLDHRQGRVREHRVLAEARYQLDRENRRQPEPHAHQHFGHFFRWKLLNMKATGSTATC